MHEGVVARPKNKRSVARPNWVTAIMRLFAIKGPSHHEHRIPAAVTGSWLETFVPVAPDRRAGKGATYTSTPPVYVPAAFVVCFRSPTLLGPGLCQFAEAGMTSLPIDHSDVDSACFAANPNLSIRKHSFPANCQTAKIKQWPLTSGREHLSRGDGLFSLFASSSIPQRSSPWNCRPNEHCRRMFCQEVGINARHF